MSKAILPAEGPIIVYVELTGPRTSRTVRMALDTGAATTIIPIQVAAQILA
jgi:hypothetical protein